MQIYYSSLSAIEQQTRQLDNARCPHCQQENQLVSHGFIHKKRVRALPAAVGKRVFCSNRHRRTGCGRTVQLYLDSTVRYLHHAGSTLVAFVLALIRGNPIERAYRDAVGTPDSPRNAYRWLDRLDAHLSTYRSLQHLPLPHLPPRPLPPQTAPAHRPLRRGLLAATFAGLLQRFGEPLCATYQRQLQRTFL